MTVPVEAIAIDVWAIIEVTIRILIELFTNQLVKYFNYATCQSKRRLDGKVVVITGASAGIGKATSLILAQRGAKIVMACRDLKKASKAREEIKAKVPEAIIDIVELELSSLDSVRQCGRTIKKNYPTIDVLVNNGGITTRQLGRTKEGHEIHFGVNYLSHFLLTLLLLDNIQRSKNGKVVNVSSIMHRLSNLTLLRLLETKNHDCFVTLYGKSKLAQILFTKELADRCPFIKTYAVHPGGVQTEIRRDQEFFQFKFIVWLEKLLLKTSEEGAQTIVHCILDEKADTESGLYYVDCKVTKPSKEAQAVERRKELWRKSLDLVGLTERDCPAL